MRKIATLSIILLFSLPAFSELIVRKNSLADSTITIERTEDENITFESKIIFKKKGKRCVLNVMDFEGYMVKVDSHKCEFKDKISLGDLATSPSTRRKVATAQQELAKADVKDRSWAEQFWYMGFPAMNKTYATVSIVSDPTTIESKSRDTATKTETEIELQQQALRVSGRVGKNLHLLLDTAQGQKAIETQQWEGTEGFGLGVVFSVSPKEDNVSQLGILYYPELGKAKSPTPGVAGNMYGPGKSTFFAKTIYENDGSAYIFNANLTFSSPYSYDEDPLETTLGGYGRFQLSIGTIFGTPEFHVSPFVGISYRSVAADEYFNTTSDVTIEEVFSSAVGTAVGLNLNYNPLPYASIGLGVTYSSESFESEVTTTTLTPTETVEQFEYSKSDLRTLFSLTFRGL